MRFGPIELGHDDAVLTPRPWTLAQAEWASELAEASPAGPLLELGCGAGHIGLAAAVLSGRALVQVDREEAACRWAARNAAAAGVADRVAQRIGPPEAVLVPVERFAVVLADPPYVPSDGIDRYPEDPPAAIDGGPDGLDVARAWLTAATPHLGDGASIVLQLLDGAQADRLAGWLDDRAGPPLRAVETRLVGTDGALVRLVPSFRRP